MVVLPEVLTPVLDLPLLCFHRLFPLSFQFSCSVVSNSLRPHELQHSRPPCLSPTPRVHPNPCPLSQWCHPTMSSSVVPFSSFHQSFPASGSFQMTQLSASGGQSIGISALTSVPPMNSQDWSLGWTGWMDWLQSKGLSRIFSNSHRVSGLLFPILTAAAAAAESHQSVCDPIDGSPPGSAVPGILQARTLEWVAISFSNAWKWKVKVKSLSCVWLSATPWTAAYQAPPSMGFSSKSTGVGLQHLLCLS